MKINLAIIVKQKQRDWAVRGYVNPGGKSENDQIIKLMEKYILILIDFGLYMTQRPGW